MLQQIDHCIRVLLPEHTPDFANCDKKGDRIPNPLIEGMCDQDAGAPGPSQRLQLLAKWNSKAPLAIQPKGQSPSLSRALLRRGSKHPICDSISHSLRLTKLRKLGKEEIVGRTIQAIEGELVAIRRPQADRVRIAVTGRSGLHFL
jgi:hypothetical protein